MVGKEEATIERRPEEEIGGSMKTKSVSPSNPSLQPEGSGESGVSTPLRVMRTETEIREMIETLERLNAGILQNAKAAGYGSPEDDMEVEAACFDAFNHNALLLCALHWVMGQDTMQLGRAPAGPLEQKGSQD